MQGMCGAAAAAGGAALHCCTCSRPVCHSTMLQLQVQAECSVAPGQPSLSAVWSLPAKPECSSAPVSRACTLVRRQSNDSWHHGLLLLLAHLLR